ncbi:unnamed protein product [Symbiodinium natans]|uniref:Uncharacterized protein n=1 Tax=Symbiodinium natans TaxID=878477 RepID=A0A812M2X4_9DINO|nr:unnamed protein product [Symbiodinium natans]
MEHAGFCTRTFFFTVRRWQGDRLRPEPESLTSFGTSWSCKRGHRRPQAKCRGAADELLHGAANPAAEVAFAGSTLQVVGILACKDGPAEDRLSRSIESARAAFAELWDGGNPDLEPATASMKEALQSSDCSCWSQASSCFRRSLSACSFAACEFALLVMKCSSGTESWLQPAKRLEALSTALSSAVQALHEAPDDFVPPPRCDNGDGDDGTSDKGRWRPFVVGSFGQACLGSMLTCLLILIPVAVWSTQVLPKSGSKKAKAGQEDLHACRTALKDFLQALLRATELQSDAVAAAKKDASELLPQRPSTVAASLSGPALEQFEALRTEMEAAILETQRKQLKGLGDMLGQRSALLKSRGAFKV